MSRMIRAAVVGYGNIGKYVVEALECDPDFEIAGIVRRDVAKIPSELKDYHMVSSVVELKEVQSRVRYFCRMGPGQRLGDPHLAGNTGSARNYLYQLRPGHEHGPHGGRKSHCRCQGGTLHDHSCRDRRTL